MLSQMLVDSVIRGKLVAPAGALRRDFARHLRALEHSPDGFLDHRHRREQPPDVLPSDLGGVHRRGSEVHRLDTATEITPSLHDRTPKG